MQMTVPRNACPMYDRPLQCCRTKTTTQSSGAPFLTSIFSDLTGGATGRFPHSTAHAGWMACWESGATLWSSLTARTNARELAGVGEYGSNDTRR